MVGTIIVVLFIIGFFMSSKSEKLDFFKDLFGTLLYAIIGIVLILFVLYLFLK